MLHLLVSSVLNQCPQSSGILYFLMAVLNSLHLVDSILSPIFFLLATTVTPQLCSYQVLLSRIVEIISVLVVTLQVILVPVCPL